MKRMLNVFLCVVGCWLLFGCGSGGGDGGNSPGDVVKRYGKALANGDTETALNCIDPAKRKDVAEMIQMGAAIASAFAKEEGGLESVTILNEDIQGDQARLGYQTKTKKGGVRSDVAHVEKINGTWYVAP
ncbi:MAG TPA: DUF4878 domain-containing protein [Verrucomicrobiae bacterium]|nr:DUF4878 domain-containing protein [Verrucomicrobiae bacterium]